MKRIVWAIAITTAILGGCKGSYHDGRWNTRMMGVGELLDDWIGGEESDYDRSRRFWDQTPEGQRR
jgi:hypothetical protein